VTRDSFGDLHPVWSPDGSKLAFVTERFSANLQWLDAGNYELALLDVSSGQVSRILGFPSARNVNPQWSEDGKSLFFLSDYTGKMDLYRLDLSDGKIYQITNLFSGIGGITQLSPAISYSPGTRKMSISVYEGGYYSVYLIDSSETLQGQTTIAQFGERVLDLLPPRTQPEGACWDCSEIHYTGYPEKPISRLRITRPKLSLDFVSQPTVAVGVDVMEPTPEGYSCLLERHAGLSHSGYHGSDQLRIDRQLCPGRLHELQEQVNWGRLYKECPTFMGLTTLIMMKWAGFRFMCRKNT